MARLVVVGGGLAGCAAALRLAESGAAVTLLEKRAALGGRASSFQAPGWDQPLDNSQHVLLGCCTNQLDLYQRLGVSELITWYSEVPLLAADGRRGGFRACRAPAPLHLAPAVALLPGLSPADRLLLGVAFGRMALAGRRYRRLDDRTFAAWLGPFTTRGLDAGFWRTMLISILNAGADRVSATYGLMFFLEGLMRHPAAFRLGVPQVSLSALHHEAMLRRLLELGVDVRLRTSGQVDAAGQVQTASGAVAAERVILAVPWSATARTAPGAAAPELEAESLVGVHLGYDEPVWDEPVLGLLGHDIDWVFGFAGGRHISVVVSDARTWAGLSSAQMAARTLAALRRIRPDLPPPARTAACREVRATFVPAPGVDRLRPRTQTGAGGPVAEPPAPPAPVCLAGEWTATGWPSTMEGAIRSGYAAAGAVLGTDLSIPDLPRSGLMRWCLAQ